MPTRSEHTIDKIFIAKDTLKYFEKGEERKLII